MWISKTATWLYFTAGRRPMFCLRKQRYAVGSDHAGAGRNHKRHSGLGAILGG